MAYDAYQSAALILRYGFTAVGAFIAARGMYMAVRDGRRARSLRADARETGAVGYFQVIPADRRMQQAPIGREGATGTGRTRQAPIGRENATEAGRMRQVLIGREGVFGVGRMRQASNGRAFAAGTRRMRRGSVGREGVTEAERVRRGLIGREDVAGAERVRQGSIGREDVAGAGRMQQVLIGREGVAGAGRMCDTRIEKVGLEKRHFFYEFVDGHLVITSLEGAALYQLDGRPFSSLALQPGQGFIAGNAQFRFLVHYVRVNPLSPAARRAYGTSLPRAMSPVRRERKKPSR